MIVIVICAALIVFNMAIGPFWLLFGAAVNDDEEWMNEWNGIGIFMCKLINDMHMNMQIKKVVSKWADCPQLKVKGKKNSKKKIFFCIEAILSGAMDGIKLRHTLDKTFDT